MNHDEDERPLDEILSDLLWRTKELKRKAQEMKDDNSLTKRIIRWLSTSRN